MDKRTGLDLTSYKDLNLENEFEISFDIKIEETRSVSIFGYVFRIINSDNYDIDLLSIPSNISSPEPKLNLVDNTTNSVLEIKCPDGNLNNWVNLRVKFFTAENRLEFFIPDTVYVKDNIDFKEKDSYKLIFGASSLPNFETKDVAPMSIRNIKIVEEGKLKHEWLLDGCEGNIAIDHIGNRKGVINNPIWLRQQHQEWELALEKQLDGMAIVAFDEENSRLFVLGENDYYIYSINDNNFKRIEYKNEPLFLSRSYSAIFNAKDNKIYCYLPDGGPSYNLDVEKHEWNETGSVSDYVTKYHQHNSYFNASGNCIYCFGGYGRFQYYNEIKKIDLTSGAWTNLPTNNSIFHPRYLGGLAVLNDSVYILGGFGSVTGNQLLSPHSFFDLLVYSPKDNSWRKKNEIPTLIDNMIVGNSFVIDEFTRDFHALVFDKNISEGLIHLMRGNLDSPNVEFVGNQIPFKFYDTRSFVSLFFAPDQEKLIAFVSYFNESSNTELKILSINYPPNKIQKESESPFALGNNTYLFLIILLISLSAILIWVVIRKRKREMVLQENSGIEEDHISYAEPDQALEEIENSKYQITFFGGFQVLDKNGEDITKKFSHLLKELFLLIMLHTFKNDKGITIEKITEILWYDKSVKSARNNRSVNIRKLRTLLSDSPVELSRDTGYWKIVFDEIEFKSDYLDFLKLTRSKTNLTKQKICSLLSIIEKGAFLGNVHYEWLDVFKAQVSDMIVDALVHYAHKCETKEEADFIIHLADCIFIFDTINEDALILKCRSQHSMGKYSLAKATYDKFSKEYMLMYDQEYERSFVDILDTDH